jgi:hypothetical protein
MTISFNNMNHQKIGTTGFSHIIVLLVIVVGVGVVGTYFLVASHAATNPYDLNKDGLVGVLDTAIAYGDINKSPAYYRGDVNHDGKINVLDIALIESHYTNIYDLNYDGIVTPLDAAVAYGNINKSPAYYHGDVNHDGKINSLDIALIKSHYTR